MDKHTTRLRRARKTRARIADLKMVRLCVFLSRLNSIQKHIKTPLSTSS